jgi:hypothetical protein
MSEYNVDDIFYFCSLIEYISRKTKNHRADVIKCFSTDEIKQQLYLAPVNHCLSFEQVADELISKLKIKNGTFDTIADCQYDVPSVTSIGRVYQRLVCSPNIKSVEQNIIDVFSSFISDEISNFNSNVYYSNPDYILKSYEQGKLLA